MKRLIEKFKEESGYTLKEKNGRLYFGGYLDLRGTQITSLPDNLTVGGSLYLEGTQITSLPDNLTVGGSLYLEGTQITDTSNVKRTAPTIYTWRKNKYIKCDGIFNVVVSHHGNVFKVRNIGKTKEYYLVGDGNGKWAHGDTIEEARKDLLYKISNRDKSKYKGLTLDSVLSYEEAIECYRVIAGACSSGTKGFCENKLSETKENYTIREIIELTDGEYGNNEFKNFFIENIFFLQEIISGWKLPAVYSGTYNECKDYMNRSLSEGNYQIVPEEQYSIDIP